MRHLVDSQFPAWQNLSLSSVEPGGHDNHTFRLGHDMAVRLPSHPAYAAAVSKERVWLPIFARELDLRVPVPIAKGEPSEAYLLPWSINRWIDGETLTRANVESTSSFAVELAAFLRQLQSVTTASGSPAGEHNFHRGGDLRVYDAETRHCLSLLDDTYDKGVLKAIWDRALHHPYSGTPVWVHGDVAIGNLIVKGGHLYGVIDFGCCGVGDPSCDLVMAWTFFDAESRGIFLNEMQADASMLARARGWALWKALITMVDDDSCAEQLDWAKRTIVQLMERI